MEPHFNGDDRVIAILLAALAGEASPDELDQLNRHLLDDPKLVGPVAETIVQEAWLTWFGVPDHQVRQSADMRSSRMNPQAEGGVTACRSVGSISYFRAIGSPRFAISAVLLLMLGGLLGIAVSQFWMSHVPGERIVELAPVSEVAADASGQPPYIGHVVRASACRWSPDVNPALLVGASLRRGELLNLVEGVAEVRLDQFSGVADLRIEGPAGLSIPNDGGCSLNHGKVTADVLPGNEDFTLETPNGTVRFSQRASIGVSANGRDVSFHVFQGTITVTAPWQVVRFGSNVFELRRGESLTLRRESDKSLAVERGASQPEMFMSRSSMRSDQLRIPDEYVLDVLNLNPLLYWRFDNDEDGPVENVAAEGFSAHVEGRVHFPIAVNNRYIDFRSGISQDEVNAFLISDQPLSTSPDDGYTLEVWFKPSHFHHGTIAALVPDRHEPETAPLHGMILELGGPWKNEQKGEQPGRIGFFHGFPGDVTGNGVFCYSSKPYDLRRWQHLVAVKDKGSVQLYLDGRLSAAVEDRSRQASELLLVVGQLDAGDRETAFVGQLDDLAFYPKPLSKEDIQRHFELVRQSPVSVDLQPSENGI